jgi:glycerol-3-phosphate cytidylyltransferase
MIPLIYHPPPPNQHNKTKLGYTTGVFDLFHIGHLNILKKARELCDYLIVGVSTDELVHIYKGKKPRISFENRIAIINAIKYVDKVVPQTSIDKIIAWKNLHFNILFHGDDWKNTPLYNHIATQFYSLNVEIIFLPYTPHISSSLISSYLKNEK